VLPDRLVFTRLQAEHGGLHQVAIRCADATSGPLEVTLSRVARETPRSVGILVLLLIVALPLLSIGLSRGQSFWDALLLDKDSETYSLSKLQFFVWTAASLFGYVYLGLARQLVQGQIELSDLPKNLPGILLASTGTVVVAQGINVAKGSKGSGGVRASLFDLVSTGGVVSVERFQFLVWTVVGVGGFLYVLLSADPGSLRDLPSIPEGFLSLMGISSFGYLGGKLARKPGPVVDQAGALADPAARKLELTLRGRSLSKNAVYSLDGKELKAETDYEVADVVVEADSSSGTASKLLLRFKAPQPSWLTGRHQLVLENPDGQRATIEFDGQHSPPRLARLDPVKVDGEGLLFTLHGSALSRDARLSIDGVLVDRAAITVKASERDRAEADESLQSLLQLSVKANPAWRTGEHLVKLENPDGQSDQAKYTV
jgi:hypothetical protein